MLGLPGTSLPVITKVQAGSWLIALVKTDLMTVISSTILEVKGSSSLLIHLPHFPSWVKLNLEGATGKRAWPLVMVESRWPPCTEGGRSLLKKSLRVGL